MKILLCLGCELRQIPRDDHRHCHQLDCNWWLCCRCGTVNQRNSLSFIQGTRAWRTK